jgi:hypothetical protein
MAKVKGKGHVKHDTPEVIQAVTLTPVDVGVLGSGQSADSLIAVVTNKGTRHPNGTPTITTTLPSVTASFVAPNICRLKVAVLTVDTDTPFEFEVDAL